MARDKSKLPVQFNIRIPLDFKEYIERKSKRTGSSQNQLVWDALMKSYGREYRKQDDDTIEDPA